MIKIYVQVNLINKISMSKKKYTTFKAPYSNLFLFPATLQQKKDSIAVECILYSFFIKLH